MNRRTLWERSELVRPSSLPLGKGHNYLANSGQVAQALRVLDNTLIIYAITAALHIFLAPIASGLI